MLASDLSLSGAATVSCSMSYGPWILASQSIQHWQSQIQLRGNMISQEPGCFHECAILNPVYSKHSWWFLLTDIKCEFGVIWEKVSVLDNVICQTNSLAISLSLFFFWDVKYLLYYGEKVTVNLNQNLWRTLGAGRALANHCNVPNKW